MITYDRIDFLEFFDEEQLSVNEIKYILNLTHDNLVFRLLISNENKVIIMLMNYGGDDAILHMNFNDIAQITCDQKSLFFYKTTQENFPTYDKKLVDPYLAV